jgi:hypothetical protein
MITPKTPSKKPASLRGFLFKTLLFDAAMRITPPLSIFALAITGAAVYKVSPEKARKTIKSTVLDLRNQLSDWIKPNEDDLESWGINRDNPDYAYECSESDVDDFPDTDWNLDDVDTDDKSYPPETE